MDKWNRNKPSRWTLNNVETILYILQSLIRFSPKICATGAENKRNFDYFMRSKIKMLVHARVSLMWSSILKKWDFSNNIWNPFKAFEVHMKGNGIYVNVFLSFKKYDADRFFDQKFVPKSFTIRLMIRLFVLFFPIQTSIALGGSNPIRIF